MRRRRRFAINRARLARPKVGYVQADLFQWTPPSAAFDVVFFSFWLSHVPPELFERFWDMVRVALSPGGRVFFVDSLYAPDSSAQDHTDRSPQRVLEQRKLNDGRTFQIVKMYYRPQELATRLAALGWQPDVSATATYFLHGACRR